MLPIRVGVWGAGAWGEKHARVYETIPEATLVGVHDVDGARAAEIAQRHHTRAFADPAALLRECEAVSVAVPTVAHCEATVQALAAGCHVLVEKPMAVTVAEADAMLEAAAAAGRTLQVGQVERFNPVLLAARPHLSQPKFVEAHRLAAFQPRSLDIDVVFDLMIHDIDAVLDVVGMVPETISAVGVAVLSTTEDIANARLEFANGCVANLTASRVSQERLRRIRFFQLDGYLSLDLYAKTGDVLRMDMQVLRAAAEHRARGVMVGGLALAAGVAAIRREKLAPLPGEPLTLELQAFLRSLAGAGGGAASGDAGRNALRVADAVRSAMKHRAQKWAAE